MPSSDTSFDVIVIGGGVAGLTSAFRIYKISPETRVLVLEANGRLGGRTLTEDIQLPDGTKESFDLGGQWVSCTQHHVIDMLKELNIETYPQNVKGKKVMQVGKEGKIRTYTNDIPSLGSVFGLVELQLFINKVESLAKKVPIEDPYSCPAARDLDSMTLETYVKKYLRVQAARDTIEAACRACLGTDMARVSVLFFLAYANAAGGVMRLFMATEGDAQEMRVKGGTQQIAKILASRLGEKNVLLNQPVKSISQDESGVTVTTLPGNTYRSKYVISTAPPNCLNRISFEPPLPKGRTLLMQNMPSGHLTKFVVTYDKAHWLEAGYSGEIVSNGGHTKVPDVSSGPLSVVYDATTNNGVPALVGFIAGKQGTEWSAVKPDVRKKAVLNDLAKCFGSWASSPTTYTEKDWMEEEYAGGCPVSYNVPGVAYSFKYLRKPEGRIFWAGTETATKWTGYISGAIQSGERAATEVIFSMNPELVVESDLEGTWFDPKRADVVGPVEEKCVFRWTFVLPVAVIAVSWLGIVLRNKYGIILSGKIA